MIVSIPLSLPPYQLGAAFAAAWPPDDRQEKVLYSVMLNLLRIRDDSQAERIRTAFEEHAVGLLPMIKVSLLEVREVSLVPC